MSDQVLTTLGEGDEVWVNAEKGSRDVFEVAKILEVTELGATARTKQSGRIVQLDFETDSPMLVNPESSTLQDDLCALYHLHEPGILQTLQQRSYNDYPYTNLGSVMVAVNPLQKVADPPNMLGSVNAASMGIPHPFAIGDVAFQQMCFEGAREVRAAGNDIKFVEATGASQSVVISGESGAGKTESTKMVLSHLVERGGQHAGDLGKRLLDTNPILEAYGNAMTLRNPNSSRFGKLLQLHFKATDKLGRNYSLAGASVETYLLERSRICSHLEGERNYHVFHMLCAACEGSAYQERLQLKSAENYQYLRPSTNDGVVIAEWPGLEAHQVEGYKQHYENMLKALKNIGLTDDDVGYLWDVTAATLHMGNIIFDNEESTEGDIAVLKDEAAKQALDITAKLLGIDQDSLFGVLQERKIKSVGETIASKRNARAATFARDAVAKSVYSKLFDWLIERIDTALQQGETITKKKNPRIGVLDIFGFETFKVNGFEQLLINYANEALQMTFNQQVFVAEIDLYVREGLISPGEDALGKPQDNSACIMLLQGPTNRELADPKTNPMGGLLMIIDSEGGSPEASDTKFNRRLHQTYNKNPAFVRPHPKDASSTFIVKHYAGSVVYTIGNFLEKNNDRVPDEVGAVLVASTSPIVHQMYAAEHEAATKAASKSTSGRKQTKPPARSIVRKFKLQIQALIDNLESTRCSFIRCIKPNAAMKRGGPNDQTWFDRVYVTNQLHCLNIPQTAEVLRNGFPTRIEYSSLVDSYKDALPENALLFFNRTGGKDYVGFVRALFYAFGIGSDSYKLGLTRVFFRSGELAALDKVFRAAEGGELDEEVVTKFKKFYVRNMWRRNIAKVMAYNAFQAILLNNRKRAKAATKLQAFIRTFKPRRELRLWKLATLFAQQRWRGIKGRRIAAQRRQELLEEKKQRADKARVAIEHAKDGDRSKLEEEADRFERERKEAEERETQQKERAAEEEKRREQAAEQAMKQHEETERAEAEAMKTKRRKTMKPGAAAGEALDQLGKFGGLRDGASRRNARMMGDKVQLINRNKGRLRRMSLSPQLKEHMNRKDRLRALRERIQDGEENTAKDKMLNAEKEKFGRPQYGYMGMRRAKRRLLYLFSSTNSWGKYYFMLLRSERRLVAFSNASRQEQKKVLTLSPNTKVMEAASTEAKRPHAFKVITDKNVGFLFSCTSETEKKGWMRAIREAIIGIDTIINELVTGSKKQGKSLAADKPKAKKAKLNGLTANKRHDGNDREESDNEEEDDDHGDSDDDSDNDKGKGKGKGKGKRKGRGSEDEDIEDNEDVQYYRELYAAQLRQEKIAQLERLWARNLITEQEFENSKKEIMESANESKQLEGGGSKGYSGQVVCGNCGSGNDATEDFCVKCNASLEAAKASMEVDEASQDMYLAFIRGEDVAAAAKPLKSPAFSAPYRNGIFSCEFLGSARELDFETYEEFVTYKVDCRYKRGRKMIGWTVSRRYKQWRTLAATLEGTSEGYMSPLSQEAQSQLPEFPKKGRFDNLRGVTSAKVVTERETILNQWLKGLGQLLPQPEMNGSVSNGNSLARLSPNGGGGDEGEDDDEDQDEDEDEDGEEYDAFDIGEEGDSALPAGWHPATDEETGEDYFVNTATGETSWVRPREDSAPPAAPPKPPLLEGWEAVKDPESGEIFYWHAASGQSSWDRPTDFRAKKMYDGESLLQIPAVDRFFELKKHVKHFQ